MIFPTYGSVFACILLSSVFMIVVCLLGNRMNFIKNNKGYKIYYKGRFVGKCKSLETFQGYRVYKNDKEAKENEEIK